MRTFLPGGISCDVENPENEILSLVSHPDPDLDLDLDGDLDLLRPPRLSGSVQLDLHPCGRQILSSVFKPKRFSFNCLY